MTKPMIFAVGTVHREHLRVVIPWRQHQKHSVPIRILGIDLWRQDRKRVFQSGGQVVGDRGGLPGIVEKRGAHDALACAEAVQGPAQIHCGGVPIQQRLQIVGQALRRETRALIELAMQRSFLVLLLVISK